jgi:hypothetical protein
VAAYEVLLLNTAVPQIQAAQAGDTYVVPRDIAVTADLSVTGNTILGNASTDTVQVNGYMGVGGVASSDAGVYITNSALSGTSQTGVISNITGTSGATTRVAAFNAIPGTAAAAFTTADLVAFRAGAFNKGAGSTVTNAHGLLVSDVTVGTNNYGITSLVSSGTNKWNIYASGTAANYFAGDTKFFNGTTGTKTLALDGGLSSTSVLNQDFLGGGTGNPSARIQFTSASKALSFFTGDLASLSERLRIDSAGNVGIGTSSPTNLVTIETSNSNAYSPSSASEFSPDGIFLRVSNSDTTTNDTGALIGFTAFAGGAFNSTRWYAGTTGGTGNQNGSFVIGNRTGSLSYEERLRITSAGNVGIGTSSPSAKLSVDGSVIFNESGADVDFRVESDTNTHALFVQGSDGNVGIGTSSPRGQIDVRNASGTSGLIVTRGATTASPSIGLKCDSTKSFVESYGELVLSTDVLSGTPVERVRVTTVGNVSIGGTADRATTVGTKALNIFDGTAPVGTLANGVSFYSASGEANVMDAAGNATLLSPHDSETNEWIFRSKHTPTGKVLRIDVERLLRFVNDHFGLDAVKEFVEE